MSVLFFYVVGTDMQPLTRLNLGFVQFTHDGYNMARKALRNGVSKNACFRHAERSQVLAGRQVSGQIPEIFLVIPYCPHTCGVRKKRTAVRISTISL